MLSPIILLVQNGGPLGWVLIGMAAFSISCALMSLIIPRIRPGLSPQAVLAVCAPNGFFTSALRECATVAPLLGLTATVFAMQRVYLEMARSHDFTATSGELASAMLVTFTALSLSILTRIAYFMVIHINRGKFHSALQQLAPPVEHDSSKLIRELCDKLEKITQLASMGSAIKHHISPEIVTAPKTSNPTKQPAASNPITNILALQLPNNGGVVFLIKQPGGCRYVLRGVAGEYRILGETELGRLFGVSDVKLLWQGGDGRFRPIPVAQHLWAKIASVLDTGRTSA